MWIVWALIALATSWFIFGRRLAEKERIEAVMWIGGLSIAGFNITERWLPRFGVAIPDPGTYALVVGVVVLLGGWTIKSMMIRRL